MRRLGPGGCSEIAARAAASAQAPEGAYVPKVRPAIGNLMTMFDFRHPDFATLQLPG